MSRSGEVYIIVADPELHVIHAMGPGTYPDKVRCNNGLKRHNQPSPSYFDFHGSHMVFGDRYPYPFRLNGI